MWLGGLALALTFLAIDSSARLDALRDVYNLTVDTLPLPEPDAESPTGYEGRQHRLILPAASTDGYHWILQTEEMLDTGALRVRHTRADYPPNGRAVHWSGSVHWWLAALASASNVFGDDVPVPRAVERVAPLAITALFALFLIAFTPLLAARFGTAAGALFALGSVAVYPFYQTAMAGVLDHHALAAMGAFAAVVLLAAGGGGRVRDPSVEPDALAPRDLQVWRWLPDARIARRWFVASAVALGAGAWISATTIAPVAAGIVIAALAMHVLVKDADESSGWRIEASLWRVWGLAGCLTSIGFYMLEYFPRHFGMRLEVNHPLYAVAWLATGDLLARIQGPRSLRVDRGWLIADLLAIALSPAVIFATGDATFRVANAFLWTLHNDYILEFRGLIGQIASLNPWLILQNTSVLPLIGLPMIALLLRSGPRSTMALAPPWRALLLLVLVPALLLLFLSFRQVRWLGTSAALWLAALAMFAGVLASALGAFTGTRGRRVAAAAFLLLVLAPFPVFTALFPWRVGYPASVEIPQVVTRDVAYELRARLGNERGVVVSGPTTTTWLSYFGGFAGLGTLYWENLDGLRATAAIYGARSDEEAKALIDRHGVTHVVIFSWDAFAREYARLARGGRYDPRDPLAAPSDAFALRLMSGSTPEWLARIPYDLPDLDILGNARVLIFEVVRDEPGA